VPAIDIDRDAAHDAAQSELAKPIYPKPSMTERFMEWLQDLIYRIAQEGSQVPGGWFTISVLLIILAVAIAIAVRIARRTMRTNRRGEKALFGSQEMTAAQHRALAEQCAGRGDWTAAIRHRLRAVARQLEEDGVVNPVPGRTATELGHDAGAAVPGLAGELSQAADTFNDVTYGERPGTETAYRMIADLDAHLRSHGPARTAVSAASVPTDSWTSVR
jgi:hypothetical protein